ncbi:MAG TPA: hypothetical protein VGQ09_04135 [Chitinophagaceae bacterium]|nr:hypothetical protein [Chitinophagaceae bacterium]
MKSFRSILMLVIVCFILSSCNLWNKVFGPKYGCPSNGRNVGAEKLLSGDMSKKEMKKARKAKFKG